MMYLSNDLKKLKENFNLAVEHGVQIAYAKLEEGAEFLLTKAVDPIAQAMPAIPIEHVVTKLMPAAVAGLGISFFSARHPEIFQVAIAATAGVSAVSCLALRRAEVEMKREDAQMHMQDGPQ